MHLIQDFLTAKTPRMPSKLEKFFKKGGGKSCRKTWFAGFSKAVSFGLFQPQMNRMHADKRDEESGLVRICG
jgi:hypothetical protein